MCSEYSDCLSCTSIYNSENYCAWENSNCILRTLE